MIDDDINVEPVDLLTQRLLRQEIELKDYKDALEFMNEKFQDLYHTTISIIDSMPEPEVLEELCNMVEDKIYNEYIMASAGLISQLKLSIINSGIEGLNEK